jgi:type II secretory pathway predicted ATPase ExeA
MPYLDYFHYDRHPFDSREDVRGYIPRQERAVKNCVLHARFMTGLILIIGKKGTGKSLVLARAARQLDAGFVIAKIKARLETDIVRSILDSLGVQRKKADAEDIITGFADARRRGRDCAIIIDDINELDEKEMAGLAFIAEKSSGLRIIASAGNASILRRMREAGIKAPTAAKILLKRPSLPALAVLALRKSEDAASLSCDKNPLSIRGALALAFLANRRISDMNTLCDAALAAAAKEGMGSVGLKGAWRAAQKHRRIVRANMNAKAQRWFVWTVLIFMAYSAAYAIYERQWFKNEAEIRKTLREQEAELWESDRD